MNTEPTKKCPKCRLWYPHAAFDADRSTSSGRQSWCQGCKDEWEHTPEGVYSRMISILERSEPDVAPLWTFDVFLIKWEQSNGRCYHCTAGLREWQRGGITLDRIDNDDRRRHRIAQHARQSEIIRRLNSGESRQSIAESLGIRKRLVDLTLWRWRHGLLTAGVKP